MSLQVSPIFLRRTRWKLIDKLRVADASSSRNIKRTARLEGTSPRNVRRWINQHDVLEEKVKDLRSEKITNRYRVGNGAGVGRAGPIFGVEVDRQLYRFY